MDNLEKDANTENKNLQRVVECAKELLHHRFVLGTIKYPKANILWDNLQQAIADVEEK